MWEKEQKRFFLEERFMRKQVKNIYLNMLIIIVFFLVFNLLYSEAEQYEVIKIILLVVFFLIGVAVILSCIFSIKKLGSIYYEMKEDRLVYFNGKKLYEYTWDSFEKAIYDRTKISLMYPICFVTTTGKFYLHKKVERLEELLSALTDRIKDYAELDSQIPSIFMPKEEQEKEEK